MMNNFTDAIRGKVIASNNKRGTYQKRSFGFRKKND